MKMLLKNPNDGIRPGNFVYDKKVKEGQDKVSGSKQKHAVYAIVPGYQGVLQRHKQPTMLDYCFSIGDNRGGQKPRFFSSSTPYVMELGDSLTDAANYVKWQRSQAINDMHRQISEEKASQGVLASFRRGTETNISKSVPGKLPNRDGGVFVSELVLQNTQKRINYRGRYLSAGLKTEEAKKVLRCLPFCRLPASTDDIIQRVMGSRTQLEWEASSVARKKFLSDGDPDGSLRKIMVWICSYLCHPSPAIATYHLLSVTQCSWRGTTRRHW